MCPFETGSTMQRRLNKTPLTLSNPVYRFNVTALEILGNSGDAGRRQQMTNIAGLDVLD